MERGSCLGDCTSVYNLALVTICSGATVSQEVYLCTATHDFKDPRLPLILSPIIIESDAFLGARSFVLPGVTVGKAAIVGACSVVTRSVSPSSTVAGNPARTLTYGHDLHSHTYSQ